MKKNIRALVCAMTCLITLETLAITVFIENDGREHLMARIKFEKKNGSSYWSDWVHVPAHVQITSKNPNDAFIGFTLVEAGTTTRFASLKATDAATTKGRTYLLSDFRAAPPHKQVSRLLHDTQMTVRDAKIEVNAQIPEANIIWFGENKR